MGQIKLFNERRMKMTAKELIKHLQKFNEGALIQVLVGEKVYEAEVDSDAPFDEEYKNEVCIFIGKVIG